MTTAVSTIKGDVCITPLLILLVQERLVSEHFDIDLDRERFGTHAAACLIFEGCSAEAVSEHLRLRSLLFLIRCCDNWLVSILDEIRLADAGDIVDTPHALSLVHLHHAGGHPRSHARSHTTLGADDKHGEALVQLVPGYIEGGADVPQLQRIQHVSIRLNVPPQMGNVLRNRHSLLLLLLLT